MMLNYLLVAVGGALGSISRFWASGFIANRVGQSFPWGTLFVNVSGSFIIGLFATLTAPEGRWLVGPSWRNFFMTGPLRLLKSLKAGEGSRLVLDLSFPAPENVAEAMEPPEPNVNTFSYRVRYGSDSLVPVHFVELNLQRKR